MEGWVGLAGRPIADTLLENDRCEHRDMGHQEHRFGKVASWVCRCWCWHQGRTELWHNDQTKPETDYTCQGRNRQTTTGVSATPHTPRPSISVTWYPGRCTCIPFMSCRSRKQHSWRGSSVISSVIWSVLCPAQVQLIVIDISLRSISYPAASLSPSHSSAQCPRGPIHSAGPPHSRRWWLISSDTTTAGQTYTAAAVSPSVQGDVWVADLITSASASGILR